MERRERLQRWSEISSSLGNRYARCRLHNFEVEHGRQRHVVEQLEAFAQEMPDAVGRGDSLIVCGPVGTGKDHLLAACLRAAVVHYGMTARWMNGLDLYGEIRDRMDARDYSFSEESFVRRLSAPQILALSDPLPPVGEPRQFGIEMLMRIVDRRYRDLKSTWLTMNAATRDDAEKLLSVPIIDRLCHNGHVIFCNWPSHRRTPRERSRMNSEPVSTE